MNAEKNPDPLYAIFEQHLFNYQERNFDHRTDHSPFVEGIVKEYLIYVRKVGISVPSEWEGQVSEELCFQVRSMLVKKTYGCHTIEEYLTKTSAKILAKQKKRAQARYRQIKAA